MKRKLSLTFLLILCLGAGAWFFLRPKPVPAPVVLHPTPQRLAQAETHIAELGKAVSAPAATSKAEHLPRTLRLSETDLNVYLAGSKSARKLLAARGVQAVQIILAEPSNVIVHATVRINGHLQNIEIDGSLKSDRKAGLRFTASKAQVGRFPLPPAVVTAQANAVASRFIRQLNRSLTIQSVTIQKKDLVIVGMPVTKASPQSKSRAHH